ncbi:MULTISPECIES: ribose ABC transporter substrate-binding protein RbsB [Clostridia]|uniref:ribose ABC transporter substrate-binding protein RbsB n=1 Tax=Clostridia TaxID=186801 RepID=UPI000EA0DF4D|nr:MULTISPECIES: ribose ABC transporter substrate-binding protein RbsB [Clostridia]NBJ70306.1 ribose ABC transporter substrate-binding protein RbsB [Roseburia sp. 1XD42-34]RKI76444.1 ribose ABC transporter substrate-binding protein RbsB [Clostridium sp. 1xD42-85]
MVKWSKALIFVLATILLLGACSTDAPGSEKDNGKAGKADDDKIKIGLSISTLNNPFFVTLRDGAESAAKEAGYEVVTADAQNDPSTQLSDIEDLIQQDIDILLVNPVDSEAVVSAVESANQAEIPVITVDRSSEGGEVVTHIASDNVAGGEIAGEFIAEQLGEKGKLVELEGISGSSAARERGEGFHNIMDKLPDIEVVAKQTADFDRTKGLSVMENIIQGRKDIDAIFAHNDEMALGAIEALESQNMLEDVIVVGFDATEDAVAAVKDGRMDATVAQLPEMIGQKAIDAAGKIATGEEVEDFIPVELELVTE